MQRQGLAQGHSQKAAELSAGPCKVLLKNLAKEDEQPMVFSWAGEDPGPQAHLTLPAKIPSRLSEHRVPSLSDKMFPFIIDLHHYCYLHLNMSCVSESKRACPWVGGT